MEQAEQAGQAGGHDATDGHVHPPGTIQLPAPTVWPMVLALGISLVLAGMVTHWVIGLLGAVLVLRASAGWFLEVLPHERHITVNAALEQHTYESARAAHGRVPLHRGHQQLEPVETFSITAGMKGGIAGAFAMIVPAGLFGILRYHSIWYPVNLLAAGGFVSWAGQTDAFLAEFHLRGLLAACAIHGLTSVLIGLLYGAMLPMFPKKPILTAGFVAPFLWTGILYSALGVISPILSERINWPWFAVSQIAFGLVCGFVVNLQVKVRTSQFQALPFAVRAGIHSDQAGGEGDDLPDKDVASKKDREP